MAYLVQVVNILFSDGMPSTKEHFDRDMNDRDDGMEDGNGKERDFLDFKIAEQIIVLCTHTTEFARAYRAVRDVTLECSLLDFILIYKEKVLTDNLAFFLAQSLQ